MKTTSAKHWWQSKTIIGALAVLVGAIAANVFGTEIEHATLVDKLTDGAVFAGAILAILGRWRASGKIRNAVTGEAPVPEVDPEAFAEYLNHPDVQAELRRVLNA